VSTAAVLAADQAYAVDLSDAPGGWRVAVVDRRGETVFRRACRDGAEARAFASTVRQHLYWLSEGAFRAYYRV
jgi:23S rRNA C2498 (ribose-2'-O)-methylase RlmM